MAYVRVPAAWGVWLAAAFVVLPFHAKAQTRSPGNAFDPDYVLDYSNRITARAYISTKYNTLQLVADRGAKDLVFRPNNKVNFGLGLSYRSVTLNIGVGIPGVNKDQDKYGQTRYLDAQANVYTKRWATNIFLQRFRGYYLDTYIKEELGWQQPTFFPTRPDLVQFNLGASTVHVFNNDRFSYRAAFNQDAWQRRSQGSLLAGGYLTYFHLRADSSLVPTPLDPQFPDGLQMRRGGFLDLGPSAGYAYTLVVRKHLFVTASMVLGMGLSLQRATTKLRSGEDLRTVAGLGWHTQVRAAAGYNSARYFFGISFNQENIGYLIDERSSFHWSVGNTRFTVAKRFGMGIRQLERRLPQL